ncbi:putative bifunctional diguanylate cyclase/phosphodiesterase [Novosphingobium panipatense]|uniref:putative bifunctional diguanylate cyclase/phosphodiesterase n=1 Tax=Novosphingobium panipatense TaxID=428991 RepID=UPI000CDB7A96
MNLEEKEPYSDTSAFVRFNPFLKIARSSDAILLAQFENLRTQIPLMYVLMVINVGFLGLATYGDVPDTHSVGGASALCLLIVIRAVIWRSRSKFVNDIAKIKRYLYGTLAASVLLSAAFGGWGYLLFSEADPARSTAIALFVFVGAISCCYCLQALPFAGWCVLIFGASPVTLRLLLSPDWYSVEAGLTFLVAAGVILRSLFTSNKAFEDLLYSRMEMSGLVTALEQSQEHYRCSVELDPQIPWISDPEGSVTELSPRWEDTTGLSRDSSLGWGWAKAAHPDDLPRVLAMWTLALETDGHEADIRYRLRLHDGSFRWFRARAYPRRNANGNILAWYGNLEDIHDQVMAEQALQESEERYRLASLASNDIIWDFSSDHNRIQWSSAAATILGYPETMEGTTRDWWMGRIHPADRPEVSQRFKDVIARGQTQWVQEFRARTATGDYLNMVSHGYILRDENGTPKRIIGSLQDVTRQREYEARLQWAAHHDALTGLPNRTLFNEHLEAVFREGRSTGSCTLLMVLDVDRFKAVNDDLGHDAGDALLQEVAARLRSAVPASASVARLGGDEFAVIWRDLDVEKLAADTAAALLASISGAAEFDGHQIDVILSAGVAVAFSDGQNAEELHKCADLALYAAKRDGAGQACRFRDELRQLAARETGMLWDARTALQSNRIVPFYQPKVCLRTGECVGFEALLRWHHQEGLRLPSEINAALEDYGLSVQLTNRMLDCVISDLAFWLDSGVDVRRIAINGAAGDFRRGDFADRILQRLESAGLPATVLQLEVTESVLVSQHVKNVDNTLRTLARAGVTIALDDFGTGYASLTHLKQFPVHTLKIDRSFIRRLDAERSEDDVIVSAVLDLARNLGISTVAEGIETPAQAAYLARKGCDVGQGYLFGRPMPAARVGELIEVWNAAAARSLIGSAAA